jgi:hypothetical protein
MTPPPSEPEGKRHLPLMNLTKDFLWFMLEKAWCSKDSRLEHILR